MTEKTRVGIIGTGNIAPAYVKWSRTFSNIDVVACADVDEARAQVFAKEYAIRALSVAALLADPQIEIIINLTIPKVHAEVSLAILEAGKHVYSEKPLAATREDGLRILATADAAGLRVGCAPDTVLGGGIQTCRKLIDDGAIGDVVAATGFMGSHGPDGWHPNPYMFFQRGAGPMLDMGPYYLTTLVTLVGGIKKITSIGHISFPIRTAGHESIRGEAVPVEVPTHMTGSMQFANGAVGTLTTTFDIWQHKQPIIEIYGSEGTLRVPDPNTFGGEVELWQSGTKEWRTVPLMFSDNVGRGMGVADMAAAIRDGRPHRASGALAYHVLDAMLAFEESSESGQHIPLTSIVERPAALSVDERF
ncbi:MAG: Gfo/Idh/MocA family oxidoreductase [Chloroflexota bacterium]|nr:Gfo/Idh/MocA family oxidoreductase [Chloroflexota bacterium]